LHALKLKSNESSWLKFTFYEDGINRINEKYSDLNAFSAKIATSFMAMERENITLPTQNKNSISNDLDEIGDIFETYIDLIEKISDENIEDIINSNNNKIETITTENISDFLELYVQLIDAQMDMYKDINSGDLTAIQAYRKVLKESINFAKKINEFDDNIDPDDFDKIEEIKDKYFKILSILSE
jgi:Na+/phosphate symporter